MISCIGFSHVGLKREENEDEIYIDSASRFVILADGMGGHKGGKRASNLATRLLKEQITQVFNDLDNERHEIVATIIKKIFRNVSIAIYEESKNDRSVRGMGTTAVVVIFTKERVYVAHVGDSRCYLICNNLIYQISADHNFVNESISQGIPRESLPKSVNTHTIYRNLGASSHREPDIFTMQRIKNTTWVLCSDGLSDLVSTEEILNHICNSKSKGNDLIKTCEGFVGIACKRGGHDNISVIIAEES